MTLGLGIDLCDVARIGTAIEKPRFLARVYTESERARIEAASGARRAELAAGLFAAKEAVSKALGTGFNGFGPWDVSIDPDPAGAPVCTLSGGALTRADALAGGGRWRLLVSVTHESGIAAAVAVLEGQG